LWLVPASGARPAALATLRRGPRDIIGAWQLRSRLYLQALDKSGSGQIFRRVGATIAPVTVPRTPGSTIILAASGSRLLLSARPPCRSHTSLLWFNPSSGHEQMLINTPRGLAGVLGAVPYGQPVADFTVAVSCPA
jgi:hypothetical protein